MVVKEYQARTRLAKPSTFQKKSCSDSLARRAQKYLELKPKHCIRGSSILNRMDWIYYSEAVISSDAKSVAQKDVMSADFAFLWVYGSFTANQVGTIQCATSERSRADRIEIATHFPNFQHPNDAVGRRSGFGTS